MARIKKTLENLVKKYIAKPLAVAGLVGVLSYGGENYKERSCTSDILVNTYTTNRQCVPDIAMNKQNIVIPWSSFSQESSYDIFAQRFDREMNKIDNEFRVNSYIEGSQYNSNIAIDEEGNFVIVWCGGRKIHVQKFNNEGNKIRKDFITKGHPEFPRIIMDGEGDYLIAFRYGGYGYIYAQRFDKDGNKVGEGFPLMGCESRIASSSKQFIVTFLKFIEPSTLYAQRYDWHGNIVGDTIFVSSSKANGLDDIIGNSSVAMNEERFVVTWQDYTGVFARIYNKEGISIRDEFRVNSTIGEHRWPDVAINNDGDFVIAREVWERKNRDNPVDIFAQRFDREGNKIGDEFRVNSYIDGWQASPRIAMSENDFVITWESNGDIYAKKFNFNGDLFVRGDVNQDRKVNLSDAIYTLDYLFAGGEKPKCLDAADVNDDGRVDLSDSIYLLYHLFNNKPIPPPFPEPGRDETEDDLGCREYE